MSNLVSRNFVLGLVSKVKASYPWAYEKQSNKTIQNNWIGKWWNYLRYWIINKTKD